MSAQAASGPHHRAFMKKTVYVWIVMVTIHCHRLSSRRRHKRDQWTIPCIVALHVKMLAIAVSECSHVIEIKPQPPREYG